MNKFLLGTVGLAALMMASGATAALKLTINDGVDHVILDDGAGDLGVGLGSIVNVGFYNNFSLTVSTAKGTEGLIAPNLYQLSIDTESLAAGSLTVTMEETGVTDKSVFGKFTGSSDSTIDYSFFIDGVEVIDLNGLTDSWNIAETGTNLAAVAPFDVKLVATITAEAGGEVSSTDVTMKVPEPSVLALFGAGLLGLGLARRRMKK